jgi:hypothetical protein
MCEEVQKMPVKHVDNKNTDKKAILFLLWYAFMIGGGLFIFISAIIPMPYHKWLARLPAWAAVMFFIIFGVCLVIAAFPRRSFTLNAVTGMIAVLSALTLKVSMARAPTINVIILLISVVLFFSIRYYFRHKLK